MAVSKFVPLLLLAHSTNPSEFYRIGRFRLVFSKIRYHIDQWRRQPASERGGYMRDRLGAILVALRLRASEVSEVPRMLRAALDRAVVE